MSKVCITLAEGFEEIEALTPADILRRSGAEVVLAMVPEGKTGDIDDLYITGAHGISVKCDKKVSDIDPEEYDLLFLPGGMPGSANLASSDKVTELIKSFDDNKKFIAAICAAPGVVLGRRGFLKGRKCTCYPGFEKDLEGASFSDENVVTDGHFITSRGMGTALDLACTMTEVLIGTDKAEKVAESVIWKW